MAKDNNPDIIVKLVARSDLACQVWADPHNEAFYSPQHFEKSKEKPREVTVNPGDTQRAVTPPSEGVKVSEPALLITFSKRPKNPELGYLLGSDRELCDIYLGDLDEYISRKMFAIYFNQYNEVIMKSSSRNSTVVKYSTQSAERRNFTWLFPQEEKEISVTTAGITFSVEVPTHKRDKMAYEANCRNFMTQADKAVLPMNLLDLSSRADTRLASAPENSQATAEPPFYLEAKKIGEGGFGNVHKARSMPDGMTVALKKFKAKNAWTLEADVLRRLAKTPHDNIVKLIDFGGGDEPFLVMGLALGGTLEQQCKIRPFTIRETGLLLRQMLEALVYLHDDFGITHRDIRPANILCDSRTHCRLADFGLAKEGDVLMTVKGTWPYMAPEMFVRKPYTCAIDLWALGMVIAKLLTRSWPSGYKGNEGQIWCAAVVRHFDQYQQRFDTFGNPCFERSGLNFLVGQYMLRMNEKDRESGSYFPSLLYLYCMPVASPETLSQDSQAPPESIVLTWRNTTALNCLGIGNQMSWWRLDDPSYNYNGATTPTQENATEYLPSTLSEWIQFLEGESAPEEWVNGASGINESLEDDDSEADTEIPGERVDGSASMNEPLGDDDSEADTEIPEAQSLNSDDWLSLERKFPIRQANGGGNGFTVPQNFVRFPSANHKGAEDRHKATSSRARSASSAAPIGVRKSVHKRNKSSLAKSIKAAAARQAAEAQSQSESEMFSVGKELLQSGSQVTSTGEEFSQGEVDPAVMDEEEWSQGGPNTIPTDAAEEPLQNIGESALEDGYKPEQLGYLMNPYNRAILGPGEDLEDWYKGRGSWPGGT